MSDITQHRHVCSKCGYQCDSIGPAVAGFEAGPGDGDWVMCLKCGHPMAFQVGGPLRELSLTELAEFKSDPDNIALEKRRQIVMNRGMH